MSVLWSKRDKEMKKDEISLPALMISKTTDTIIFATGYTRDKDPKSVGYVGVAVGGQSIGEYGGYWDPDCFELYDGELTLKNAKQ